MAIALKNITNVEMKIMGGGREIDHIGHHTLSFGFDALDKRYHIWLSYNDATGTWVLGSTLYSNRIKPHTIDERRVTTKHLSVGMHKKAIAYALDMAEIGRTADWPFTLDSVKLNKMIADYNIACRERRETELNATNKARAAKIRDGLHTVARADEFNSIGTWLLLITTTATDEQLNALDAFFNITI